MSLKTPWKLLVLDIDNTVFDWVTYYVHAMYALLNSLESLIKVPTSALAAEAKEVFTQQGSIEYPFVVQEMPSVIQFYGRDIDRLLSEAVAATREAFNGEARKYLKPYPGVVESLTAFKTAHPQCPIVALTDAPRYVAMWKLNKLGLLPHFNAVYGLADPMIPVSEQTGRVKVDPEILLKHLQRKSFDFQGTIRILPDEYEKPGTRGLKTVLMDYELDHPGVQRREILWVGDNLKKDVGLGRQLGVATAWAEYGTRFDPALKAKLLTFSPDASVHKNIALPAGDKAPTPDFTLQTFAELLEL